MLAAREKLGKEIDLVTIIKSRRYTALALKALLPRDKRLELKKKSKFFEVNLDAANSTKVIPFTDPRNKDSFRDYSDDCFNGKIEILEINSAYATMENCNGDTKLKDFNSSP